MDTTPGSDWARPHYQPSPQKADLMYVVVGDPPETLNISRVRHHVDRIEPGLQVSRHARSDDPAWFDAWFSSALGYGLDPTFGPDADTVRAANRLSVVRGEWDDPDSLAYLRNTIGVVSAIAESGKESGGGAVAIFDVYGFTWWRPADWLRRFVDASEFRIEDQTFIVVTEDERYRPGIWTHTHGMRKFGRPELQVRHLPGAYDESNPAIRDSGLVLNGVATYLARGAVVTEGQTMHLASYGASITFFEHDDKETRRQFNNASLEICDIDPELGISKPGIAHLLGQMERRHGGGA